MTLLISVFSVGIIGALAAICLLRGQNLPVRWLFITAAAFPLGFSIISLLLFFTYLIHPVSGFKVTSFLLLLLAGAGSVCFFLRKKSSKNLSSALPASWTNSRLFLFWHSFSLVGKILLIAGFIILIWAFLRFLTAYESFTLHDIYGGWDARFCWTLKAKFIVRDPSQWTHLFHDSIGLAHPGYPLLLPGSIAWGWLVHGHEAVIWPPLVAFLFMLSFSSIILWYLWSFSHPICGLLGKAFLLSIYCVIYWSSCQYADVPLAFFITTATVLLTVSLKTSQPGLLWACGWMAGCAAWTKNEGFLLIAILGLITLFSYRKNLQKMKQVFLPFIGGLFLPVSAILILKIFLTEDNGEYLDSGQNLFDCIQALFGRPQHSLTILSGSVSFMTRPEWSGLWFLFGATLLLSLVVFSIKKEKSWPFAAVTGLMLLGYFAVLHLSPHNIVWQMQTAFHRLLIHAAGPALIFTFECWGKILPPLLCEDKKRLLDSWAHSEQT